MDSIYFRNPLNKLNILFTAAPVTVLGSKFDLVTAIFGTLYYGSAGGCDSDDGDS